MKKVINYTQITFITAVIAFAISVAADYFGEGYIFWSGTIQIAGITVLAVVYIIAMREIKYFTATDDSYPWYAVVILVTIATSYFALWASGNVAGIASVSIIVLAFIAGLFHARYSLAVNLTFGLMAFYFGFETTEVFLRNLGIGLGVALAALIFKLMFFTKWSKLTEKKATLKAVI